MLEYILQKDRELLIFLNNLGSEQWDSFWLAITNQFHWSPLFLLLLFFIFKKLGWKQGIFSLFFIALMIAFSDQFTNFIKYSFERIRPCNEVSLNGLIRDFTYKPRGFSFYSGHAAVSSTFTVFIYLTLKNKIRYLYFLFLFPLIFGYSRIYLGVHYPLDVTAGYFMGTLWGCIFYKLFSKVQSRFSI